MSLMWLNEGLSAYAYMSKGLMVQDSEPTKQHSQLKVAWIKQSPTHLAVLTLGLIISLVWLLGDRNNFKLTSDTSATTSNASSTPSSLISASSSTFTLQASRSNRGCRKTLKESSAVMAISKPVPENLDKKRSNQTERENPDSLIQHQFI